MDPDIGHLQVARFWPPRPLSAGNATAETRLHMSISRTFADFER